MLTGNLLEEAAMAAMEQSGRSGRSSTDEFRRDAVAMVIDGGTGSSIWRPDRCGHVGYVGPPGGH